MNIKAEQPFDQRPLSSPWPMWALFTPISGDPTILRLEFLSLSPFRSSENFCEIRPTSSSGDVKGSTGYAPGRLSTIW